MKAVRLNAVALPSTDFSVIWSPPVTPVIDMDTLASKALCQPRAEVITIYYLLYTIYCILFLIGGSAMQFTELNSVQIEFKASGAVHCNQVKMWIERCGGRPGDVCTVLCTVHCAVCTGDVCTVHTVCPLMFALCKCSVHCASVERCASAQSRLDREVCSRRKRGRRGRRRGRRRRRRRRRGRRRMRRRRGKRGQSDPFTAPLPLYPAYCTDNTL